MNIDSLLVSAADWANRRWISARRSCAPAPVDAVVIDSVAAMVTKAEIEGEMGDSHVGVQRA